VAVEPTFKVLYLPPVSSLSTLLHTGQNYTIRY
jgi:hypothetical protein